jgi:hypothetical protein
MTETPGDDPETAIERVNAQIEAAIGPLKYLAAVNAQIALAAIPADALCCCLCSIYEPHDCGGWRVKDLIRQVPAAELFGWTPPPTEIPVCRGCHDVTIRKG